MARTSHWLVTWYGELATMKRNGLCTSLTSSSKTCRNTSWSGCPSTFCGNLSILYFFEASATFLCGRMLLGGLVACRVKGGLIQGGKNLLNWHTNSRQVTLKCMLKDTSILCCTYAKCWWDPKERWGLKGESKGKDWADVVVGWVEWW